MDRDITPFIMSAHENSFSLLLTEFDAQGEVFKAAGYESGGYGWHGVAESLIRLHAPQLADKVKFDPESSMFCAYGPDRAALEELGALLKRAMNEPELLKSALENADPELMD